MRHVVIVLLLFVYGASKEVLGRDLFSKQTPQLPVPFDPALYHLGALIESESGGDTNDLLYDPALMSQQRAFKKIDAWYQREFRGVDGIDKLKVRADLKVQRDARKGKQKIVNGERWKLEAQKKQQQFKKRYRKWKKKRRRLRASFLRKSGRYRQRGRFLEAIWRTKIIQMRETEKNKRHRQLVAKGRLDVGEKLPQTVIDAIENEHPFSKDHSDPNVAPAWFTDKQKWLGKEQIPPFYVIEHALAVPIKQEYKDLDPVAYATSYAFETMSRNGNYSIDLSEAYLNWVGHYGCLHRDCYHGGVWIDSLLRFSQASRSADVPLENACPSKQTHFTSDALFKDGPQEKVLKGKHLTGRCHDKSGTHVKAHYIDKHRRFDAIIVALQKNQPVIAAVRMSDAFIVTDGLLLQRHEQAIIRVSAKANKNPKAEPRRFQPVVITGYIGLPPALQAAEGRVCYVVVNSWGKGWGAGGRACLSERWLYKQFVHGAPVVAVVAITVSL